MEETSDERSRSAHLSRGSPRSVEVMNTLVKRLAIPLIVVVALGAMLLALLRTAEPHRVAYPTFAALVREGKVASVVLSGDTAEVRLRETARVPTTRGLLEDVLGFSVALPENSETVALLREQNVEFRSRTANPLPALLWNAAPAVLLPAVFLGLVFVVVRIARVAWRGR